MTKKKYTVSILKVNSEQSIVDIEFEGGSAASFSVVEPAKIEYAKEGTAEITLDNNEITYLRMGGNIQKKQGYSGGSKPQSYNQRQTEDPKKQKLIVRQHTQKVAVEVVKGYLSKSNEVFLNVEDFVGAVVLASHLLEEDIFRD